MELLALMQSVEHALETGGYFILFAVLFACGLGLPLPEDLPLLIGGFGVAQGRLKLTLVAICCWCGIIGGDIMLYNIGKKFGLNVTRLPLIGKHVTEKRIKRAQVLFEKWGIWVVAVGRLFAGIRGAMVIAAGTIRFNFWKFIIADGLAALVSGGMWIALGWWAGHSIGDLSDPRVHKKISDAKFYFIGGAIVLGVLIALYAWWRHRHHRTPSQLALKKIVPTPITEARINTTPTE